MTDQGVTQGGERDVDGAGFDSGFHYPTEAMLLPCIRTRRLGFFRIESPAPRWVSPNDWLQVPHGSDPLGVRQATAGTEKSRELVVRPPAPSANGTKLFRA